jgi:hypothetical protein
LVFFLGVLCALAVQTAGFRLKAFKALDEMIPGLCHPIARVEPMCVLPPYPEIEV